MDRWKLGGQLAATAAFGWVCWRWGYEVGERHGLDSDPEPVEVEIRGGWTPDNGGSRVAS